MIFGAHVILYSRDAEADRTFLAEVLGVSGVDAGEGWLILPLPPSEVAVHPAEGSRADLYLMCDDLHAEVLRIRRLGTLVSRIERPAWGSVAHVRLPGGGTLGLYQPRHPLAIAAPSSAKP